MAMILDFTIRFVTQVWREGLTVCRGNPECISKAEGGDLDPRVDDTPMDIGESACRNLAHLNGTSVPFLSL